MSGGNGQAGRMRLLARVEQARETRCRAALRDAEAVRDRALARAAAADADLDREERERHDTLRGTYDTLPGARDARVIQALRATELILAARQTAVRRDRDEAMAAAMAASDSCRIAGAALRLASLRSERRTRLARELGREEALAIQKAEEDATADETADRMGASGWARS